MQGRMCIATIFMQKMVTNRASGGFHWGII